MSNHEGRVLRQSISKAAICVVIALATLAANRLAGATSGDQEPAVRDFQARVAKYVEQRKKDAGSSPRPTNSPDKLSESQKDLAEKVKALRRNAGQGDIFTPDIAAYFRQRISSTLEGPNGAKIRASLRHAEPLHGIELRVNEPYPQGIPLQSTPPTLLSDLPVLPEELEYRIVGRDLVLVDIAPNLIVDFVPNAMPPIQE